MRAELSARSTSVSALCEPSRPPRARVGLRYQSTQRSANASSEETPFAALPKSKNASPYDIFQLSRSSTSAEIKARYYELVKVHHPDRALARLRSAPSTSKDASADDEDAIVESVNENFKRIREAYSVLSNQSKRRMYDQSGFGWDPLNSSSSGNGGGGAGFDVPVWKGGFPRTAEERAAYEAWSNSLRRGSPGSMNRQGWQFRGQGQGHDRYGWQTYAGNTSNLGSDWFYGYGHSREYLNANREPRYTTNPRFFLTLSLLTMMLGIGQYVRLREESKVVVGLADRRHQDAAKSLDDARHFARSDAGRARLDEMRKRARERGGDAASTEQVNVGRGGPSGREAYQDRMRRIGRDTDDEVDVGGQIETYP